MLLKYFFSRYFEGLWCQKRGWLCGKLGKKPTGSQPRDGTGSRQSYSLSQPWTTGGSQGFLRTELLRQQNQINVVLRGFMHICADMEIQFLLTD